MPMKHTVDMTAAMRRLADRRIEDAMQEGKFDNLAGAGRPLDLDPIPADENARLTWWALRILRQNDVIPDEVRWRKALDRFHAALAGLTDETHLAALVKQINELVHKINTLGTNALPGSILPVCEQTERRRLRERCARRDA
jgi:hypothetical protein